MARRRQSEVSDFLEACFVNVLLVDRCLNCLHGRITVFEIIDVRTFRLVIV